MKYKMEELVPIVAKLSEKYTGFESSSITYEKAEQLMGAVIYCMHEANKHDIEMSDLPNNDAGKHGIMERDKLASAQKTYEIGYENVIKKVKASIALYNSISTCANN